MNGWSIARTTIWDTSLLAAICAVQMCNCTRGAEKKSWENNWICRGEFFCSGAPPVCCEVCFQDWTRTCFSVKLETWKQAPPPSRVRLLFLRESKRLWCVQVSQLSAFLFSSAWIVKFCYCYFYCYCFLDCLEPVSPWKQAALVAMYRCSGCLLFLSFFRFHCYVLLLLYLLFVIVISIL